MSRSDAIRDLEVTADAMDRLYSLLTKDETEENEYWGKHTIDELPELIVHHLAQSSEITAERDRLRDLVFNGATFYRDEEFFCVSKGVQVIAVEFSPADAIDKYEACLKGKGDGDKGE